MPLHYVRGGLRDDRSYPAVFIAAVDANERQIALADFVCAGVEDEVQFTLAVACLPTGGGQIMLSEGTFTFSSQWGSTHGQVMLRGCGMATNIVYNGSDPVMAINGQTWIIRDLNTDAGGLTLLTGVACYWKNGIYTELNMPGLQTAVRTFGETTGAGTYTATVAIPAGAVVLDVRWMNQVLWAAATSATLNVGDADDTDGYLAAVDIKAAPIADVAGAGGISSFLKDTGAGAYSGLTKYSATASTITATVVTVGTSGSAGRSRLIVLYTVPIPSVATKA